MSKSGGQGVSGDISRWTKRNNKVLDIVYILLLKHRLFSFSLYLILSRGREIPIEASFSTQISIVFDPNC